MHDLILGAALFMGPVADSPATLVVADSPETAPGQTDSDTITAESPDLSSEFDVPVLFGQTVETISAVELSEQRGGSTFIVNNQTLLGIVQGNVVGGDYVAGQVALSDSALSNFNGLLSLAINTGLQSNIISGMAVTINLGD